MARTAGSTESLPTRVLRTMRERRLARAGDTVLVAVSGGPDSVALLHVLCEIAPELRVRLAVAHLDHGMRGANGAADAEFVRGLARDLGLPCTHGKADVPAARRAHGTSSEEEARAQRYRFLTATARECGAASVATGHTADDLAETLLLFMLRGAGDGALAGFPWRRPLAKGVALIRPLRATRREELLAWLGTRPYREDETNADRRFTRSQVRHELLPLLVERYNPRVVEALGRAADRWAEAAGLIQQHVENSLVMSLIERGAGRIALDADTLARYDEPLRLRVVRAAYSLLFSPSSQPLEAGHTASLAGLALESRGALALPGGITACREEGALVLRAAADRPKAEGEAGAGVSLDLRVPGRTDLVGFGAPGTAPEVIEARVVGTEEGGRLVSGAGEAHGPGAGRERLAGFDLARVEPPLVVRHPLPGDRMRPLGMRGTRKLQDILVDRKVPRAERSRLWLVCDRNCILWIVGVGRSEDAKLTPATERVLLLENVPG